MRTAAVMVLVGLLALGAALPAAPAQAQEQRTRRYERETHEADLGQKKDQALDESLKEDLTRQKTEEAREARPALRFDQFRRTVEVQLADKRREQIDTLDRLLKLGQNEAETPDFLFRLAELYWEESKHYFMLAGAKDDEIIQAQGDPARVDALRKEKAGLEERSRHYQQLAVGRYREIVKSYPQFGRIDEVLWSLGSNLWEQGDRPEAVKVLRVLVKRFPESQYVPDAYLAFGEYFFDEGDVRKALAAYKKAASFPESKVYGFALYKQGWCYYNLGEWTRALDTFKAVVFYGELATATSGDNNKTALVREARRDYVLAYSHVGDPKSARPDFSAVGGDTTERMLRTLGNRYYDMGQDRAAIIVYRDLIEQAPLSPQSPGFQARIVDAAQRIGNKPYTVKQARLLVRVFEEVDKAGVATTDEEKRDLEEARAFAERTLRTLALVWHSEAKKTRDDSTFRYAEEMYRDYAALFPDSRHAYEIHFYFGELLYHLEDWAGAAEQYTKALLIDIERIEGRRTGEDGQPEKPGRFRVDAAFNAVLAYEEVARKFEQTEQRAQAAPGEKLEIPPAKQALLDACERYLQYVPEGDKRVEVTYKAANIFYRYNHFEEAVERFAAVALEHPDHELAEFSANLVLDSYNLLDRPDKVNEWARRFAAVPALAKGRFAQDLREVIEDSALTMIERQSQQGDHAGAAKAYEAFVQEFAGSKNADTALYNASVAWAKARRLDRALELRGRIMAEYPRSELLPEAIFTTAKGYESIAEFDKAAGFYEEYARRYERQQDAARPSPRGRRGRTRAAPSPSGPRFDESKAQEALFNAALLREGLGEYARARADRLSYVERWPAAKDASELFLSVAELHAKEGRPVAAARHLDAYLERFAKSDLDQQLSVRLRQFRYLESAGRMREAAVKLQEIQRIWKGLGSRRSQVEDGLLAVATAELAALAPEEAAYRRMGLAYPWEEGVGAARLTAQLTQAQEILAQAEEQKREEFTRREIRVLTQAQEAKRRLERGISLSDRKFRASIEKKSAALKDLGARYAEIVKFRQGEPALCALEKLGDLHLDFVETLKNAPTPPYVTDPEQQAMFRDLLAQQALPVEDQAVEAYATAVAKSRELMLYNDCAERAAAALERLRPGDWGKPVERTADLGKQPEIRLGGFLLSEIQPLPAAPEGAGELPTDVASAPPPAPPPGAPAPRTPPGVERVSHPAGSTAEPAYAEPDDEDLLP